MKKKMKSLNKNILFIGAGNMAEALIGGIAGAGLVPAKKITATDIKPERLAYLKKKFGVSVALDATSAARTADVVFLAVKPQQMETALKALAPSVQKGCLVISIAAGVTAQYVGSFLKKGTPVVRSMPNLPVLLGAGAIAISAGKHAVKSHLLLAQRLFESSGTVVILPEKAIDAVTALSGSGPAYVFLLAEVLQQAGEKMGLPTELAATLARQTVYGSGKMLAELATPAAELRRNVTSPGGTTEAALRRLEAGGYASLFTEAIFSARKRAGELSR